MKPFRRKRSGWWKASESKGEVRSATGRHGKGARGAWVSGGTGLWQEGRSVGFGDSLVPRLGMGLSHLPAALFENSVLRGSPRVREERGGSRRTSVL